MQVAALISITLLAALATDFVVPILTVIERDLGTDAASVQQLISMFLAGYAVGQIPCGIMADRIGRMPVLYSALGVFLVGSIICVFASSITELFAGRFVQGLGSAGTAVMARTLARDLRSGPELSKLLALYVSVLATLPILGPAIGGWLGSVVSWQSVFVLILVASVLSIIFSLLTLRETLTQTSAPNHRNATFLETSQQFFNSRQSVWSALLLGFGFFGFMSILSGFANAIVDVYERPTIQVGPTLSAAMLFFVASSIFSRMRVSTDGELRLIKYGVWFFAFAMVWNSFVYIVQPVSLSWFLVGIVFYATGLGLLFPNTIAIALAPLPHIAGLASSFLGTLQISFAFAGSAFTAYLYSNSISHIAIPTAIAGVGIVFLYCVRARFLITPS